MRPTEGEPTFWFALAAEDIGHHAAVTRLTDRVLEEAVDWFEPETRDAIRRWREPSPMSAYWKVTSAEKQARALGLPLRGRFDGERGLETVTYRAQLLLWQHAHVRGRRIDVGFIARDTDHTPRKDGARRAVESGRWPFLVVLAFPHPEVEVWPIAIFEPRTQGARERVDELTRRLGYSPIEHPERLTSTVVGGIADAKKVRDALFADEARGGEDWLEIDLDVLRQRGRSCGLADFLSDVETIVVTFMAGGKVDGT